MNTEKLLKELAEAPGISSIEDEPRKIMHQYLQHLSDRVYLDGLGSMIGVQNENADGIKIQFAAHMDEVGFMVKKVDERGYLRLQPVGSMWTHVLLGQRMDVKTDNGSIYAGVIGSPASHGLPKEVKERTMAMNDLYLDVGASSQMQVYKAGIRPGCMVLPHGLFTKMLDNDRVMCKALDDRAGCAAELIAFEYLYGRYHAPLYCAGTIQEEPGLRGARTATDIIHPDLSLAVDTTVAGDTPADHNTCRLGGGAVLSMIDSNTIAHRGLIRYAETIAAEKKIPIQYAVFKGGGTDSGNIHKSFEGILSMTISIPIRYMHSMQSIISMHDVEACAELMSAMVLGMNQTKYKQLLNGWEDDDD
jgi:putative aminopeptidase FrvX